MSINHKFNLIILIILLSGCAAKPPMVETKPKLDLPTDPIIAPEKKSPAQAPDRQGAEPEDEEYVEKNGVIFAKTDFKGVLESNFVRLMLVDRSDPGKRFELHIGDNSEQTTFPWEVRKVTPGYFYIELPEGSYKMSAISIPVGSTLATEAMNVTFDVFSEAVTYIGTLSAIGTKEKIRLGGVPVIKPGFEYTVNIIDERKEAMQNFKERYPESPVEVNVKLMKVNNI